MMQGRFGSGGQAPEGMPQGMGRGMGQGMGQGDAFQGTWGTIESVDGDTVLVSTNDGIVKVQTTETTLIQKMMPVASTELEVDEMVLVQGSENEDGSINARSVQSMQGFGFTQRSGGQ